MTSDNPRLAHQKTPRRDDCEIRTFFVEVFKRIQRIGAFLDLIEYDKVCRRIDLHAETGSGNEME